MQHEHHNASFLDAQQIVIGKQYSGQIVDIAMFGQADRHAITIVVDTGVSVILRYTPSVSERRDITIVCRPYASVEYFSDGISVPRFTLTGYIEQASSMRCIMVCHATQASDVQLTMYVQGAKAQAHIQALFWCDVGAICTIQTRQVHMASDSHSSARVHCLIGSKGQLTYRGTIDVDQTAIDTQALQSNKNILLDRSGRVLSYPILQVRTNQVQCAHGGAVGILDQQQLLYLQSRGISEAKARQILLQGFLSQVVDGCSSNVQDATTHHINNWISCL